MKTEQTELEAQGSVLYQYCIKYLKHARDLALIQAKRGTSVPGTELQDDIFDNLAQEVKKPTDVEVVGEKVWVEVLFFNYII